jgi:hypothetical protein
MCKITQCIDRTYLRYAQVCVRHEFAERPFIDIGLERIRADHVA